MVGMERRYALLEDNQRCLEERLGALRERLPGLLQPRVCGAMVIGSVAEGRARDDSDLDLLLVLASGDPRRRDYRWWDEEVEPRLGEGSGSRFPVQPLIVARRSLGTTEPNLENALRRGVPLWDPEGLFG